MFNVVIYIVSLEKKNVMNYKKIILVFVLLILILLMYMYFKKYY